MQIAKACLVSIWENKTSNFNANFISTDLVTVVKSDKVGACTHDKISITVSLTPLLEEVLLEVNRPFADRGQSHDLVNHKNRR